jgi:hypothetical protein
VCDRVGVLPSERKHVTGGIKGLSQSAFDQRSTKFCRRDHQRLLEAAPCNASKLFQALGQVRRLLFDRSEVAEPKGPLARFRSFSRGGGKLGVLTCPIGAIQEMGRPTGNEMCSRNQIPL